MNELGAKRRLCPFLHKMEKISFMEKKKMLFIYNPRAGKAKIRSNLLDIIDIFTKSSSVNKGLTFSVFRDNTIYKLNANVRNR